jgi:hypothetical protein
MGKGTPGNDQIDRTVSLNYHHPGFPFFHTAEQHTLLVIFEAIFPGQTS